MGGHELLWAWYYNSRGCMREQQGRLEEAIDDARLAVAAKERVLDPDSAEVALSLGNLANHMAYGADFAGALEVNKRAVDILTATLGRDHPRTALIVANHGQFLWRLGQFEAARVAALSALDVFERETDGKGLLATLPMRTLGLCYQGMGHFDEAVAMLERALGIREANHAPPLRLAEVRFPLARAVLQSGRQPARAVALARQALAEYAQTASTPTVALDRAELERWLATHAPPTSPPRRRRLKKKQAPSRSTPKASQGLRGRSTTSNQEGLSDSTSIASRDRPVRAHPAAAQARDGAPSMAAPAAAPRRACPCRDPLGPVRRRDPVGHRPASVARSPPGR